MSGQLDLRGLGSHGKPDAAARQRGPLSAFAGSQAPTRPPLPPLRHTSLPRAGFCAREESPCRPDVGETLMRRAGPRPVPTKPTGPPKPQPAPPALTPQSQAPSVAVVGCSPKARRVDWLRPCTTPRPGATPCRCWSRWGSWRRARARPASAAWAARVVRVVVVAVSWPSFVTWSARRASRSAAARRATRSAWRRQAGAYVASSKALCACSNAERGRNAFLTAQACVAPVSVGAPERRNRPLALASALGGRSVPSIGPPSLPDGPGTRPTHPGAQPRPPSPAASGGAAPHASLRAASR